ncbi:MAG: quinone-dependent dihydroorotate dehydrogenase [Steroidobacteraceae bacterium]|jgi:dihydroorotate dehydrogenase
MWYTAIRPALFALEPERAHQLALSALQVLGRRTLRQLNHAPIECMGLRFPNRVGLAAGFDKNGIAVDGLGSIGFGFIEIGTVTPRAQPGQPRPRLFRLPAERALINRLGFPNEGAERVAQRLRGRRYRGIVGVNIGKNLNTPVARAVDDYVHCFRTVRGVADYVAVNVSSPNTAGLRDLQTRERLEPLLTALLQERERDAASGVVRPRLVVKISPDVSLEELKDTAALFRALPIDGVIATNTTVKPEGAASFSSAGAGGVSGRPLHSIALRAVAELRSFLGRGFPIVGVGGIDSPQAALAMRAAGADLIQIYTGLIYRGPALVSQCIRALADRQQAS